MATGCIEVVAYGALATVACGSLGICGAGNLVTTYRSRDSERRLTGLVVGDDKLTTIDAELCVDGTPKEKLEVAFDGEVMLKRSLEQLDAGEGGTGQGSVSAGTGEAPRSNLEPLIALGGTEVEVQDAEVVVRVLPVQTLTLRFATPRQAADWGSRLQSAARLPRSECRIRDLRRVLRQQQAHVLDLRGRAKKVPEQAAMIESQQSRIQRLEMELQATRKAIKRSLGDMPEAPRAHAAAVESGRLSLVAKYGSEVLGDDGDGQQLVQPSQSAAPPVQSPTARTDERPAEEVRRRPAEVEQMMEELGGRLKRVQESLRPATLSGAPVGVNEAILEEMRRKSKQLEGLAKSLEQRLSGLVEPLPRAGGNRAEVMLLDLVTGAQRLEATARDVDSRLDRLEDIERSHAAELGQRDQERDELSARLEEAQRLLQEQEERLAAFTAQQQAAAPAAPTPAPTRMQLSPRQVGEAASQQYVLLQQTHRQLQAESQQQLEALQRDLQEARGHGAEISRKLELSEAAQRNLQGQLDELQSTLAQQQPQQQAAVSLTVTELQRTHAAAMEKKQQELDALYAEYVKYFERAGQVSQLETTLQERETQLARLSEQISAAPTADQLQLLKNQLNEAHAGREAAVLLQQQEGEAVARLQRERDAALTQVEEMQRAAQFQQQRSDQEAAQLRQQLAAVPQPGQLEQLREELEAKSALQQRQSALVARQEQSLAQLQVERDTALRNGQDAEQELQKLQEQCKSLQESASKAERVASDANSKAEKLDQEKCVLAAEQERLQNEVRRLEGTVAAFGTQQQEAQTSEQQARQQLEASHRQQQETIGRLEATLANMEADREGARVKVGEETKALQERCAAMASREVALEQRAATAERQFQELEQTHRSLQQTMEEQSAQHQQHQQKIVQLETAVTGMESRAQQSSQEYENKMAQLMKERDDLASAIQTQQESYKARITALQQSVAAKEPGIGSNVSAAAASAAALNMPRQLLSGPDVDLSSQLAQTFQKLSDKTNVFETYMGSIHQPRANRASVPTPRSASRLESGGTASAAVGAPPAAAVVVASQPASAGAPTWGAVPAVPTVRRTLSSDVANVGRQASGSMGSLMQQPATSLRPQVSLTPSDQQGTPRVGGGSAYYSNSQLEGSALSSRAAAMPSVSWRVSGPPPAPQAGSPPAPMAPAVLAQTAAEAAARVVAAGRGAGGIRSPAVPGSPAVPSSPTHTGSSVISAPGGTAAAGMAAAARSAVGATSPRTGAGAVAGATLGRAARVGSGGGRRGSGAS